MFTFTIADVGSNLVWHNTVWDKHVFRDGLLFIQFEE